MRTRINRRIGPRAAALAACALLAAACGSSGDADVATGDVALKHVRVSREEIAALAPGESLLVDLGAKRVVYHVHLDPALDIGRVVLVSGEARAVPLAAALEEMRERVADPRDAPDERLLLTGDPSSFEELTSAELAELRDERLLVRRGGARSPAPAPQSTDPCEQSRVYLHGEAGSGAAALDFWGASRVVVCEIVCEPGSANPCYDAPGATQDVGLCRAGQQTCNALGTAWGSCLGQVAPAMEICGSAEDEDCNGRSDCGATHQWSKSFGGTNYDAGLDVAADAGGNVLVVGTFGSTINFGDGPLTSPGRVDAFVAKLDPGGATLWSRAFGGSDWDGAFSVASDSLGNIVVVGQFSRTAAFGATSLASAGVYDAFVAKLDPSGNLLWVRQFGDALWQDAQAVGVDGADNIVVAGVYNGAIDFGTGPLVNATGSTKAYVAKLDPNGNGLWARGFSAAGAMAPVDIAVSGAGEIAVTGRGVSPMDLGGGPVSGGGGQDVFVAKLDAAGGTIWSSAFGDALDDAGEGVALDAAGNVLVTGHFAGQIDVGGVALASGGGRDVFLAKINGSGGALFGKRLGGPGDQWGTGVAVDGAGNIAISGNYLTVMSFGDSPGSLTYHTAHDRFFPWTYGRFLARLDPSGEPLWTEGFTRSLDQTDRGLAVDGAGNVLLTGKTMWSLDFGGGPLATAGANDVVLAKFAP
ncbi:hypothetical protein [Sorangium sp. So ce1099]|uniref:hypothetical protein n=1 Tax=Sorangium sp. So ce1099 TaxID=3133331 RepID=UPI003F638221